MRSETEIQVAARPRADLATDLINRKELASRLGCGTRTIDRWQRDRIIPFSKPRGVVMFSWCAVQERLSQLMVRPCSRDQGRRTRDQRRRSR